MSLPATIILGIHILVAMWILSPAFHAMLTRTVSNVPKKQTLILAIILVVTGLQNFITVMEGGVQKPWHMWAGIKTLLGLHIAVVSVLAADPAKTEQKRLSMYQGVAVSGVLAVFIAVYLGYIRTH